MIVSTGFFTGLAASWRSRRTCRSPPPSICYHSSEWMPYEISHVTRTFGSVTAVDDLSLTVPQGSIYGFIGPNGSGKTTTMRMIVNIFYPDRGEIRLFGDGRPETSTDLIGYLPEERGLYQKMTVQALLEFYGELRSGRGRRSRSRALARKTGPRRAAPPIRSKRSARA